MNPDNKDLDVVEITSENDDTKYVKSESSEVEVPRVGMEFDSVDHLYDYCLSYARKVGYLVKKTGQKSINDVLRYVLVACGKSGKYKPRGQNLVCPQPSGISGCKAKVAAKLRPNDKWEISKVNLEHNHILSPGKVRHYKCNRKISPHVARQLKVCDMAGIKPSRSYRQQVVAAGGHENIPFTERDVRNHIRNARVLRLGEGDSVAIQEYFLAQQRKNNGFIFSMDLDENCQLRNVFWTDRRSREAYKEFRDVVTFDTTYLTNMYGLPFAPFVGVNHHGQSILLGCGLLSNEDTDTFAWLFSTWLSCMEGIPPDAIITDQDRAMQNAIAEVFPKSRHRWCLWHVMKKVPEKLGSYKSYEEISLTLSQIVYETLCPEEFDRRWNLMIKKYGLQEIKLVKVFVPREKTVGTNLCER